ncbi:hypothetical protein [Streptomyces sp. NPDC048663]|uniref:hypothetical protein n=1 Tax=Streptomyces sp. NPDC048663 TaxID=3155638 RepID=UPI0034365D69
MGTLSRKVARPPEPTAYAPSTRYLTPGTRLSDAVRCGAVSPARTNARPRLGGAIHAVRRRVVGFAAAGATYA